MTAMSRQGHVQITLTHKGTQTLKTERLTLRRFALDDAPAMFRNWVNDPRVTRYLTWEPHGNMDVTQDILDGWCALYQNPAYYHWGIEYEGQLIGGINVVRQNEANEVAELGYCIGANYWGRGIVTEAARAVTEYLFFEVGFHRVSIEHAVQNPASGKVADHLGMKPEGILRGNFKARDGEYWDIAVHGILREEWETKDTYAN